MGFLRNILQDERAIHISISLPPAKCRNKNFSISAFKYEVLGTILNKSDLSFQEISETRRLFPEYFELEKVKSESLFEN